MTLLLAILACSAPLAPPKGTDTAPTPVESDGGSVDGGGGAGGGEAGGSGGGDGACDTCPAETGTPDTSPTPPDPCGDPTVLAPLLDDGSNPRLSPISSQPYQGADNIYAPDVVRLNDTLCLLYYGGQGSDGHDRIFLATSTDCHHWHPYPNEGDPQPIIDRGSANHVNDPSVIRFGSDWFMYYTVAATGEDDRIHLATSTDGFHWSPQGLVLDVGPAGTWDSVKVGRPAALVVDGQITLWYDGNDSTARHVGRAQSPDGRTFTRDPANPLVLNAGAVDVEQIAGTYVMLREAGDGTYASSSADGQTWCDQGRVLPLSGADFDRYGQVTPFVFTRDNTQFDGILYGGASDPCWCKNRIAQVYVASQDAPADPSAGCEACLVSADDCAEACREAGYGVEGVCATPGSTDPGACCACIAAP